MNKEQLQAEAFRDIRAEIENFDKRGYEWHEGLILEIKGYIEEYDAIVSEYDTIVEDAKE